jgi:hypothetical protein
VGAGDLTQIVRGPGRLAVGPTNLATAWPHGGTGLGTVADVYFEPGHRIEWVNAEDFGEPVEGVLAEQNAVLGVILREWNDDDAVSNVFYNSAAGGSSGARLVTEPGSHTVGEKLTGKALKVLFTPRDQTNDPGVLIYKAVPVLAETVQIQFGAIRETGLVVVFKAIRDDTSGNTYQIGRIEDMTL